MMDYFKRFYSHTLAGSGSQFFFRNEDETLITRGCCFYKIFEGGEFPYSFLFSNTIDSTYSSGSKSHKNLVVDSWVIEEMLVGVTAFCDKNSFERPTDMKQVLFSGQKCKVVNPGELFCSDDVVLNGKCGEYICLEIAFSGKMIPYHDESIIPTFVLENGEWVPSKKHPFPSMIGSELQAKKKIAFLGDSITQGIGTPVNSYAHWNAVLSEGLGREYSYWNLGLGFGRADDAASDGMWLYKAKQNDFVFVCYGVNDILQGYDSKTIKKNLQIIADKLSEAGVGVIMQTVPPFDYAPEHKMIWEDVNTFIKEEIKNVSLVFDCVKCLSLSESEPYRSKYGGHPNSEGCRVWGEALLEEVVASKILSGG